MAFLRVLGCACVCLGSVVGQGQTTPVEYTTFFSHGRAISCAVYSPQDAKATVIVLQGANPTEVSRGQAEAQFFAQHGYRVLIPDYVTASSSRKLTAENFRRWAQVVDDILIDLNEREMPRNKKVVLAGSGVGASVALVAASNNTQVSAVVEWSGFLPNEFFAQVQNLPPLLILHGEQDEEVPVMNARQLVRLCKLKDFVCEAPLYPNEGHVFSASAMESSNLRALNFFRTYLR